MSPKSFLILDGQHRVYGFSLAKSQLRVPVVIYNGLSRRDETRLFIDINSKQKGVPNELLLDIKSLADYESDHEQQLRELFDQMMEDPGSQLYGLLTPASKAKSKISRVTFNSAIKPLLPMFEGRGDDEIYVAINNYLRAFAFGLDSIGCLEQLTNTTVFKASAAFFPVVASRVKDRFGSNYSADNFNEVMAAAFADISPARIRKPGSSFNDLASYFESKLKSGFVL